jgi:hypothetical protein
MDLAKKAVFRTSKMPVGVIIAMVLLKGAMRYEK